MFTPINLEWAGKGYVVPANRVLMAIAEVEEVLTLDELQRFSARGTAPVAKLSMAFGRLLRFAGAKVDDDDVYSGMFVDDQGQMAAAATSAMLALMLPPESAVKSAAGAPGKSAPGKPPKVKGNSS
jgi:hypothetical protein